MDPLSQGALGASLPQALEKEGKYQKWAMLFGFFGGMAADLDVLIRSSEDPLLFLEYHRQFTHSLIFIPIGGFIAAFVLSKLFRSHKLPFKKVYLYTTLGYATHALLDSCTSYGTQLFWPFSNMRVAWNNVAIIDPLFTLPLVTLVGLAAIKKKPIFGKLALFHAIFYLSLGLIQNKRVEIVGYEIAKKRGHQPISMRARPSFANLILWKVVYETKDRYYVDAVRLLIDEKIYPGESLPKLDLKKDFPWLDKDSQHAKDVERFRWFSKGFIAKSPVYKNFITDVRYSLLPNSMSPLWGIRLNPKKQEFHVDYQMTRRDPKANFKILLKMIKGEDL